jgi:hypothetical protein
MMALFALSATAEEGFTLFSEGEENEEINDSRSYFGFVRRRKA